MIIEKIMASITTRQKVLPYYLSTIVLLFLFAFFNSSCGNYLDKKEKEFIEKAKCYDNCQYLNSIKNKFVGKWYVGGKILVKGIRYDPAGVEGLWEFTNDGLIFNVYGETKILSRYFKIIDDKTLEQNGGEIYKYKIGDKSFTITSTNILEPIEYNGQRKED